MRLALYQPDIAANAGTIMRLCACFQVALDIIEPCGFVLDDKKLRRAGMDYIDLLDITRHASWEEFLKNRKEGRMVLLTTKATQAHHEFVFRVDDILMVGRESAGVPEDVHAAVDARLSIPMAAAARSLNVALAASIVLAEGLRQTNGWPQP